MTSLAPSKIRYSQDSILCFFDSKSLHSNVNIGRTLDDLVEGRLSVDDIPTISVVWHNGNYFTTDNRRLWLFRNMEILGKCRTIAVKIKGWIKPEKLTTKCEGLTIQVRGYIEGRWWRKATSATRINNDTNRSTDYSRSSGRHSAGSRSTPDYSRSTDLYSGNSATRPSSWASSSHHMPDPDWYNNYTAPRRENPVPAKQDSWCAIL